jgi:hypothetical protein
VAEKIELCGAHWFYNWKSTPPDNIPGGLVSTRLNPIRKTSQYPEKPLDNNAKMRFQTADLQSTKIGLNGV